MNQSGTQVDLVTIRVEPGESSVAQRDAVVEAIRRALPPGRWLKSVSITRDEHGGLNGVMEREARV